MTEAIDRLMSKVKKCSGPNGDCWEFTGYRDKDGYGYIKVCGVSTGAHRFSWEHHNSKNIPAGTCVMHKCDNPPCVNPEHLSTGSPADNTKDMLSKDRCTKQFGTSNGNSKLKESDVIHIYNSVWSGGATGVEMSRVFNISTKAVSKIKHGETWDHITNHNGQ